MHGDNHQLQLLKVKTIFFSKALIKEFWLNFIFKKP